jgi:aminopeptidase N|nr:M1 family metallopeptidase [Candidatus Krumholzibacteria bacterium]
MPAFLSFPRNQGWTLVLLWTLFLTASPVQARTEPTHPELSRWRLEATKLSAPDKNGALGDAAVTSNRYDMLRNALDLRIDPEAASISGQVGMVFASEVADLETFVFDLSDAMEVTGISHLTGPLFFTHAGDSVVVTLPATLGLGAVDSLTVAYRGTDTEPVFTRGLMFRTYTLNDHTGPSVASLSQPAYAKYWWPCKDRPGDKLLCTVAVTVPDDLVGVSNGIFLGSSTPEPGWITYSWQENYPIASYLVSIAVADYVRLDDHCSTDLGSEIPLNHWVFPPDEDDGLVDFAPVCEMMDMCEDHYGPYPFQGEKYGHAEFLWGGAMEHQTVTSIGYTSILGDGSRDWLIVHELGHQWFGDSLTPRTWADIWLNEGFATYTEALWSEHKGGREAYLNNLRGSRQIEIWASQGPVYDPVPVFPGRVIYDKGAWILHMLRERMGDGPFFELVDEWANQGNRPGGTVTTEEFIALAGTYAGENLEGFFWPYLNELDVPRVGLEWAIIEGTGGNLDQVQVTLRQVQLPLFDNVFPVVVTTSMGSDTLQVHLDGAEAVVTVPVLSQVTGVTLDPESSVLWSPSWVQYDVQGLSAVYPNPVQRGFVFLSYELNRPARAVMSIHDVRGHLIWRRDLGRVEPLAAGNDLIWDLQDNYGRTVPSGVFWAVLELDGQRTTRKFSVAR